MSSWKNIIAFYWLHIYMNITILNSVDEAFKATGLAVVIDVFRAFSSEVYMFNNGAKYIIPVQTLEEAYELKKLYPEYILIWERWWLKPEWFDYGNSPTELSQADFSDKVIVHTTSNGTKWLALAKNADTIITGSFINVWAIIHYISHQNPNDVFLISTSHDIDNRNEDIILAEYIRDVLNERSIDLSIVKEDLQVQRSNNFFFSEIWVPITDFNLCVNIDTYDFVIMQKLLDWKNILEKITL